MFPSGLLSCALNENNSKKYSVYVFMHLIHDRPCAVEPMLMCDAEQKQVLESFFLFSFDHDAGQKHALESFSFYF